jgi:hypothetical protein
MPHRFSIPDFRQVLFKITRPPPRHWKGREAFLENSFGGEHRVMNYPRTVGRGQRQINDEAADISRQIAADEQELYILVEAITKEASGVATL